MYLNGARLHFVLVLLVFILNNQILKFKQPDDYALKIVYA